MMRQEVPLGPRLLRGASIVGAILVAIAGLVLLFARTVDRDLNHDEHQFLAPAALWSREGLLPWVDYPIFHVPNLVFAYGAADWLSGNLILGAKMICFAASAALLILLIRMNVRLRRAYCLAAAAIVATLLLTDPVFLFTAGKTWNHEVPTTLLVGAFALFVAAATKDQLALTALAGVLAGLGTGSRLTIAPALVGFALLTWFFPGRWPRRVAHLAVLTFSATAALAPTLYFLGTATEAFVFGNLEFPRLRLSDLTNTRVQKTAAPWRKIRYFFKEIVIPSWPIFALWAATAVAPGYRWFKTRSEADRGMAFLLVLLPFVLFGCFTPARYQYQHCFVVIPLILVGVTYGINSEHWVRGRAALLILLAAAACIWPVYRAIPAYAEPIRELPNRDRWFDARVVRNTEEIAAQVGRGKILTFAPTYPLMAGRQVYSEFASGPFAWRSAELVPQERRAGLHIVAPSNLADFLAKNPPAAVITGVEDDDLEKPFVDWARAKSFREVPMRKKQILWLPPQSSQ